jgi:two-component system response regulator AtoC
MYAAAIEQSLSNQELEIKIFYSGKELIDNLDQEPDIITLDHMLPDMSGLDILKLVTKDFPKIAPIILSGQNDVNVVVQTYKLGAKNYIVKNENALVELNNAVKNVLANLELTNEIEVLREELEDRSKYKNIIGESTAVFKVMKLIQRVEKSDTLVMVTGESGTGKELIAEAIHQNSNRRRKPFIAVNLAAIPNHLLEDELFGHEKGAFTGASSKRLGKFEEADGGTLFLDEIGEMDITLQTKLLRVLQDGKLSRLGSNKLINTDVRIVTATNRNLSEQVKLGLFRQDLYYRIQGFLIHLPKLKDRGNDIMVLALYFLNYYTQKHHLNQKSFDESARLALLGHKWPGNIRELIAMMDRCVLMTDSDVITSDDLIFSESI